MQRRLTRAAAIAVIGGSSMFINPAFTRQQCDASALAKLPATRIIPTRVQDTDFQGHINNVAYYAFM